MELTAEIIDSDWQYFTPKVLVSYIPYDNTTDANTGLVTSIEAIVTEAKKEEYGTEYMSHNRLRTWNLRASQVGIAVTKRGIIEEGDGTQWVVIKSLLRSVGTRWKCECYALEG